MYFDNFGKLLYDFKIKEDKPEFILVKDITQNVRFVKEMIDSISFYQTYIISDGETPEIISEKVYESQDYHWIIMLANERYDYLEDFPMSTLALDMMVDKKYGHRKNDVKHFIDSTTGLVTTPSATVKLENKQIYLDTKISDVIHSGCIIQRDTSIGEYKWLVEAVNADSITVSMITGDIKVGDEVVLKSYKNNFEYTTTVNKINMPHNILPITHYAHEYEVNEAKRVIKIIPQQYIPQIVAEFEKSDENMSDNIRFAGDIRVDEVLLIAYNKNSYNVTNQLVSIQIFEDLFAPFTTGILTFKDSLDFMNALPMIGQETVSISMHTPNMENDGGAINMEYYVSEIKSREYSGDRNVVYEIAFISKEAIIDCNVKLSRGYSGKVSEIASKILMDSAVKFNTSKDLTVEETKNSIQYVSNYWSPIRNMHYLCEHAINQNQSASYMFFENRTGFNFGSLETMCKSPFTVQNFKYDNSTQRVNPVGGSFRDLTLDYQRITLFSLKKGFNLIRRLNHGMVSSSMFTSDITTKKINLKMYDYFSEFNNRGHLNTYPTINNNIPTYYTAKIFNQPKQYGTFSTQKDATNSAFIQKRISEILQGDDFKIEINVPGRLDYTVGQCVHITSFQIEPIVKLESSESQVDYIFTGKYLIGAINHYITRETHQCAMELIKDSYVVDFK